MLSETGKNAARIFGTILVMLADGYDEKDIAEELGMSRMKVAQKIADIAGILDEYMEDGRDY